MKVLALVAALSAVAVQKCSGQRALTDSMPILEIAAPTIADSAWLWDQRCSGVPTKDSFPLARVHWFVADMIAHSKKHDLIGYWAAPDTIILDLRFASDFQTVAHELLHYLLQHGGHPLVPWDRPCRLLSDAELFKESN